MKFNNSKWFKLGLISALAIIYGGYKYFSTSSTSAVTYQTSVAERGMLISSITASGTITSGDTTYITTGATGTVSKVYVKNGDTVKKDQKLAEIVLDETGQQNQTIAWNNYLTAKEKVADSNTAKNSADKDMWSARQVLLDAEKEYNSKNAGAWNNATRAEYTYNEKALVDKNFEIAQNNFKSVEQKYNNANSDIYTAQAKAQSSYRNYQKVSSTIYAPADGILNNFTLATGVILSGTTATSITVSTGTDSTTNSTSVTAQRIGAIKNPEGKYQATVNLTEVDVTKVQSGQKATIILDAFPNSTLTGTVLAVNTSGTVSSGVTSYAASILLDKVSLEIYTNMALSAQIITSTVDDVVMVPSVSVKTNNGQSSVQILKNGKPETVNVEVGSANDTQTIIKSGINEGDVVVTSSTTKSSSTTTTKSTTSTGSVFGGSGGGARMPF